METRWESKTQERKRRNVDYLQDEYNRLMEAGISPRSDEVRELVAKILAATNVYYRR